MMSAPFKIGISSFLALVSFLLALIFLVVFIEALSSIHEISKLSSSVRRASLPAVIESQKSLINMESLRRIAEAAYLAEDPKVRRSARIDAQALAAASVFSPDSDYQQRVQTVSKLITSLVEKRDAAYANGVDLSELAKEFSLTIQQMAVRISDTRVMQDVFRDYMESSLPFAGSAQAVPRASQLTKLQQNDRKKIGLIVQRCRAYAENSPDFGLLCARQQELYNNYALTQEVLVGNNTSAREQWRTVDQALKEMRDAVRSDAEFAATDALTTIEARSASADTAARVVFACAVLVFLGYLLLMHWHIVRPIHWTSRKLQNIQQGKLDEPMPVIRIAEMQHVGLLLDRFSEHLAELYSHASQLEEDAAEKRDLEDLMRAVFQASLDGYCVWSPSGVRMVNQGFLSMFGLQDMDELLARRESMGFSTWAELEIIYEIVYFEGVFRKESIILNDSGEKLPCEISYLPIRYQDSACVLSYFRDMRMQKRTEEELRQAKEEAEEAAKVKSDFLARMSHEIRTPMNGVLGLTRLALDNSPPPHQKEYLEKIQASARILLGVINDILDFSKMESGKLTLEQSRFSFSAMLGTVLDLFCGQAEAKGLYFALDKDKDVPDYVLGDELRLSQVLLNLCSNAVKFTEQGGVTLSIALAQETESTVFLRFAVIDTGVGMSPEQLSGLFQPFAQADTSTTRKYGGTGLGLVISKLLVERMHGEIEVSSIPGSGSIFRFTIPLEKAAEEEDVDISPDVRQQEEDAAALRGLRVLLAEDNEINREIAVALLESLGLSVLVADNGAKAVQLLEQQRVDGVLMDIQMPIMDGLSAATLIRGNSRESIRTLPIIAMTAHAMQEDKDKSLAAGMNDHITKPIDAEELRSKLLLWLKPRP